MGFPGGSEVKASACNAGDLGSISGSGRSPGEGNGNPLQYSCLENPMDGGASWATVHGIAKSRTRLSDFTFFHYTLLASLVAQMVKSLSAMQETRVWSPGKEDPLEKEMASHSSILAWKIPWTEEPGRLQSNRQQSRTRLSDLPFTLFIFNTHWAKFFCQLLAIFPSSIHLEENGMSLCSYFILWVIFNYWWGLTLSPISRLYNSRRNLLNVD